jgi:hypothetical protein
MSEEQRKARLAKLYPARKECPHCWFNLFRYRLNLGLDQSTFIPQCPHCNADQHAF